MPTREQESLEDRWTAYQELDSIKEHWYWRPGWRIGRSFYTWHLTFEDAASVHALADTLRKRIDGLPVNPVADEGLHLTMQGLGFTDEITHDQAQAVVNAAQRYLSRLKPFELSLGPVDPDAEGIGLLVQPWEAVQEVRSTIREAIADAWGPNNVPEKAEGFRPHVTLAYSDTTAPAAELIERLSPLREFEPATVTIRSAELIDLNRDERAYRWKTFASVPLGT